MKKLLFYLIIIALIWTFFAQKRTIKDFVLAPVHMVQGTSTGIELNNIRTTLILYHKMNNACLPPARFTEYIHQEFRSKVKDPTLDPWKQPYRYALIPRGFQIDSSGPDRQFGTADDLRITWKE